MTDLTHQDSQQTSSDMRAEPRTLDPGTVVWLDPMVAQGTGDAMDESKFVGLLLPEVSDESDGGTALVFKQNPNLAVGQEILLTQNATSRRAEVRNIAQLPDGRYRLGFEWKFD